MATNFSQLVFRKKARPYPLLTSFLSPFMVECAQSMGFRRERITQMKRLLLAGIAVLAISLPAHADIIINSPTLTDLGATGFGDAPRLLTLQNNPLESGGTIAGAGGTTQFFYGGIPTVTQTACTNNGDCGAAGGGTRTGANESLVYNVGALGWATGANVGIGLDTNQTGNSGPLSFNTLTLTLYSSTGAVLGSFSGNAPVDISEALLASQQGNGNSVFNFGLDAAEQAEYDAILAANGGAGNVFEGLRASFGCGAFGAAVCGTAGNFSSNDGAESFLAFVQPSSVPGPIVGAGLPGVVAGLFTLLGLNRHRRRRIGSMA